MNTNHTNSRVEVADLNTTDTDVMGGFNCVVSLRKMTSKASSKTRQHTSRVAMPGTQYRIPVIPRPDWHR